MVIEKFGASEIQRLPEEADILGLSEEAFGGPYGDLVNDRSMAAVERGKSVRLNYLAELERIAPDSLTPAGVRKYAALRSVVEATIAADSHGYGQSGLGWTSPYVISFADGAFTDLVKFLTLHTPIHSRAEADTWLKRLEQMDDAMRDERRRFEVDIAAGAVPPRSVLQRTLDKAKQLAPGNPGDYVLVQHLTEALAQVTDIPEADITALTTKAAELVGGDIKEEYTALIGLLEKALAKAADEPGVWRLPQGEDYYADALKLYSTTAYSPTQINELGVKLVDQITARLDPLLADAGLVEGTVGARLRVLATRPDLLFPDTPEGRLSLLQEVEARMKWANGVIPRIVAVAKPVEIVVRETPRIAQDTASKAYYRAAPLQGDLPAVYNITLRSTADLPIWTLPSLTYHEGAPGHHLQVELARSTPNQPVINYLVAMPSFNEGWATYGEDLAAEFGAYQEDPLGRIGYLQSMLLRASRMVADTGIHAQRWKRQEAIDYLTSTAGVSQEVAELEVDRYAIRPGLATTYMLGREQIRRVRIAAQRELGERFDLKAFHAALLGPGPRPLPVLESDMTAWVESQRPPPPPEE
jgi:uncharacterized protein (DUF885 family)